MNLSKIEQLKIYKYLLGEFQFGTPYKSPLPKELRGSTDKSSSFNIWETKDEKVLWKDFGGGGISGDAFDLIVALRPDVKNYYDAVKFYKSRIKNSQIINDSVMRKSYEQIKKHRTKDPIVEVNEEFQQFELDYWSRFKIFNDQLKFNRVYSCAGIDWGNFQTPPSNESQPSFIYDLSSDRSLTSWKYYAPSLTVGVKSGWASWNLSSIVAEGYYFLDWDSNKDFVFSSGGKDRMVFNNLGYASLNSTSEASWRKLLPIIPQIKASFRRVFTIYDGDAGGIRGMEKLYEETGIPYYILNYPEGTKDVAEVVEKYGYEVLQELINERICN